MRRVRQIAYRLDRPNTCMNGVDWVGQGQIRPDQAGEAKLFFELESKS